MRSSVNSLLQVMPTWMEASAALGKINSLELSQNEKESTILSTSLQSTESLNPVNLKLEQVQYSYLDKNEGILSTVGPFDFELNLGEIVFITGGNGSGKTTLVKLLTLLYSRRSGQIYLNDTLIEDSNADWYRSYFDTVFSDFYLFDGLSNSLSEPVTKGTQVLLDKLKLGSLIKA